MVINTQKIYTINRTGVPEKKLILKTCEQGASSPVRHCPIKSEKKFPLLAKNCCLPDIVCLKTCFERVDAPPPT